MIKEVQGEKKMTQEEREEKRSIQQLVDSRWMGARQRNETD